jgi:hypothetical protein
MFSTARPSVEVTKRRLRRPESGFFLIVVVELAIPKTMNIHATNTSTKEPRIA